MGSGGKLQSDYLSLFPFSVCYFPPFFPSNLWMLRRIFAAAVTPIRLPQACCCHRNLSVGMAPSSPATKQTKLTTKGGISRDKSSNSVAASSTTTNGTKRPRPDGTDVPPEAKKSKANSTHKAFPANPPEPNEVDDNTTVLERLDEAREKLPKGIKHTQGGSVLYWMRMKDIRIKDNKALSLASETAKKFKKNLVILHVLSPGDYKAHDRGPARIDWVLRNLKLVQEELDTYNIPLAIRTFEKRKTIPKEVLKLAREWKASHIFANLEYEIDELRRDIALCEAVAEDGNADMELSFFHDYVLVEPGTVLTGAGKPYSVFSPFHKNWHNILAGHLEDMSRDYPLPSANGDSIRSDSALGKLFEEQIPESVDGYELKDEEFKQTLRDLYPAGTDAAEEALRRFTLTKSQPGQFQHSPTVDGGASEEDPKSSRLAMYTQDRSLPNIDGGSRMSCVAGFCLQSTEY